MNMAGPSTPISRMNPLSPQDPITQLNTFKSYVAIIADPAANTEKKLKAAQELCESFELIGSLPQYPQFIGDAIKVFMRVLQESEPVFVSEYTSQQLRKMLLELIHRIPSNDHLKPRVVDILNFMFQLIKVDCEDNALVALRIIIELSKQFRPAYSPEVSNFLRYVIEIYKLLPTRMDKMFEHRTQLKVADISEVDLKSLLQEVVVMMTVVTEKKNAENQNVSYNLLPRAEMSLKVLAELPIIVVLMYQLYKNQVQTEVMDMIPLVIHAINMQPPQQLQKSEHFNKEVFVDFVAAQIKTLSFLAYIIRIYQELIGVHSRQMAQGMLDLFAYCPSEVAHLRKELLIAARHILATDLRIKFISHIDKLFDEATLIGVGWTAHESLRPLAYSTLADLVHHIRQSLSLSHLSMAVSLFSKNIHDDSLPSSIQNMSCKLLLNLVDSIRQKSDSENENGRELLLRILEVYVLKFKAIAEIQMPYLLSKCKQPELTGKPLSGQPGSSSPGPSQYPSSQLAAAPPLLGANQRTLSTDSKEVDGSKTPLMSSSLTPLNAAANDKEENKLVKVTPTVGGVIQVQLYSVVECRSLVKTLVSGVKTITWGLSNCKAPNLDLMMIQNKQLLPKETLVYIRLVKYALLALDIYTINTTPQGQTQVRPPSNAQTVRTREEKEVLEHFAGVFVMLSQLTFKEIFSTVVEYMVARIHSNYALQIIANSFLASSTTSATFATILVEFLLKHMDEMGSNAERSNLYLKLFKLVFGSVSLLANENEQMLKPHLHTIVNKAMDMARMAKEPYNYFLLLRALFRSIGGGSHDLLYQEFLPLLPNLLQGLNNLQSGLHKQHMKDLFVELCLTVPVRLSSLLPYLPMLMDPLVSALNGSQTLVSQGLRTLELCVDNLQPDFLFSHIEPVKAELMQALWHCLGSPSDSTSSVAFRVLGKFGGSNRRVLSAPQELSRRKYEDVGPTMAVTFHNCRQFMYLPVMAAIESAFNLLKTSAAPPIPSTNPPPAPTFDLFYQQHAWNLVKTYLITSMAVDCRPILPDDRSLPVVDNTAAIKEALLTNFSHVDFGTRPIQSNVAPYICIDAQFRSIQQTALSAMLIASTIKELVGKEVVEFVTSTVTQYTLVAISKQAGPKAVSTEIIKNSLKTALDPHTLVDAILDVMGSDDRELCPAGLSALSTSVRVAVTVLGTVDRVFSLPFFEYFSDKALELCYERSWYNKMGGCEGVKFLADHASISFLLNHQVVFLKALIFVILDLSGEVSNGALTLAKSVMNDMCAKCCRSISDVQGTDLVDLHTKSSSEVIKELAAQICSPNQQVREQVVAVLRRLSEIKECSVTELLEPVKEVFNELVPPKKHLLRFQPPLIQMGIMEGNAFCLSLEPRLVAMDMNVVEFKLFYQELSSICETDDANLVRLNCYKNLTDFTPLRISAIKVLSTMHYVPESRAGVFSILYKALNSTNADLHQVAYNCLKKFVSGFQMDTSTVHQTMRPLLQCLQDFQQLDLHNIRVITDLTQIFPTTFNEKLCEQMLAHLKKWLDYSAAPQRINQVRVTGQVVPTEQKICAAIINMLHLMAAASAKIIDPLVKFTLKGEKDLCIEASSPFREPLVKFLKKHPEAVIDYFFTENKLQDAHYNRFFLWLVDQEECHAFRNILMNTATRLLNLITPQNTEQQFFAISVIKILVDHDETWLIKISPVVQKLLVVWVSPAFHQRHQNIETVDYPMWQEPTYLIQILLCFFKQHTNELELLFHMLRCFTSKYIPQFTFFKEFLEETVAKTYTAEWKRNAFFKFVEIFHMSEWPQEVKTKILQHILIPCFTSSFDKEEGEQLIGGPPTPDQESDDNIISIFINKVVDPDNPFGTSDALRIYLLQLSCLFVERASRYIHDAANKKQGNKLRRLMTFAWPCLLTKTCVDPATKYHGHLLLAHIIAKFAIHKRIVLQVFHSLLKAHAVEARGVVRQALDVLTPAMPGRMEDENNMLTHWTKKIIIEEGHTVAQLVHVLQLIYRHNKVYYPVRHHLVQNISNSIQRLGLTPTANAEHRKLAVDLAEVIICWEVQRIKEEAEESQTPSSSRSSNPEVNKPIDKVHCDTAVNFLLRIACQANEVAGSPGEQLSRRCFAIIKRALSSEVWPNAEPKIAWFDRILTSVEGQQPNVTNICMALELLTFLIGFLKKETILTSFKALQRGIAACMTSPNTKVVRMVHNLLSKLMSIFPTEPAASTVASKFEELECLYACVSKLVYEGLANYEKAATGSIQQLFGTIMILKAACQYNPSYIDRLITSFMRVLQRITREHLNGGQQAASTSGPDATALASELLTHSLDLVKNRVGVMSPEMRKGFLGNVLMSLIDKTTDTKIIKTIIKMLEEWIKNKSQIVINQSPSLREKAYLLLRLMTNIEKRFPEDSELNAQFLELIHFIYCDETLKNSDFISKLETAFLAGLRSTQPHIRQMFAEVFNANVPKNVQGRLNYIISSQNWEPMSTHFWIKQCNELVLNAVDSDARAFLTDHSVLLPPLFSSSDLQSQEGTDEMVEGHPTKMVEDGEKNEWEESEETLRLLPTEESIMTQVRSIEGIAGQEVRKQLLRSMMMKQARFLQDCGQVQIGSFTNAIIQLSHNSTQLAYETWLLVFPRAWKLLTPSIQQSLAGNIVSFLSAGNHLSQRDCQPSALQAFYEALTLCSPPVPIRPSIAKYLAKSHNIWHRILLGLEEEAFRLNVLDKQLKDHRQQEDIGTAQLEMIDALTNLYSSLKEEDMFCAVWMRRCKKKSTATALSYEQHGLFDQASDHYFQAVDQAKSSYATPGANLQLSDLSEYRLWEEHLIRCSKELNNWETLGELAQQTEMLSSPELNLECSWRLSNWNLAQESLAVVEQNCVREKLWKMNMYRCYLAICHSDGQHMTSVEKLVETATSLAVREWRRLPSIVSQAHIELLQASQQIIELQEAASLNNNIQPSALGREQSSHDIKAIIKTWRNRMPAIMDDLSHWSDIFTWRQIHFKNISNLSSDLQGEFVSEVQQNAAMLGIHHMAVGHVEFGKVARKHGLTNVCIETLSKIHNITSVPAVDCFQKVKQQVKCYLQIANNYGTQELEEHIDALRQGLQILDSMSVRYFNKEMTSEFYAYKATYLALTGEPDEANRAFSSAVQLNDSTVKAWALWGEFVEELFMRDKSDMVKGSMAMCCFLHACRSQSETKARKYLAKVLWLLTFDDDKQTITEMFEKYAPGMPIYFWIIWIPQLLSLLVRNEGRVMTLLSKIGTMFPQAVYFPTRTLYLTLKMEHYPRERSDKTDSQRLTTQTSRSSGIFSPPPPGESLERDTHQSLVTSSASTSSSSISSSSSAAGLTETVGPIKATSAMWRCSRVMHTMRDTQTTILSSLENIVEPIMSREMVFRENWYEDLLKQLKQALAKCFEVAFSQRENVYNAQVSPQVMNFIRKVVSTLGSVESPVPQTTGSGCSADSRRLVNGAQDAMFQKVRNQFLADFDFSINGSSGLFSMIARLRKWIKILEARISLLPKSLTMDEKCKLLSFHSSNMAEIELPGEFLVPQQNNYYVKIERFLPKVDVVQKMNTSARRLYIRGSNGKIYPYLVINDAIASDSRSEERVLQLFRMLNTFLSKNKETARRLVQFTVPRIVALSPVLKMVEDNPHSLSLLSIFRQNCDKRSEDQDQPIFRYYEKFNNLFVKGQRPTQQHLVEFFKDIQLNLVPKSVLKTWALNKYVTATDYWTFRKNLSVHMGLLGLTEYCLHLTRLDPGMMLIHQDSGFVSVPSFRFAIHDETGELDGNRPVPFRLTPNMVELMTPTSVMGPMVATMVATARCLVLPQYKLQSLLCAILRDEFMSWHKKKQEDKAPNSTPLEIPRDALAQVVTKAVQDITIRLNNMAMFEEGESKVTTLVFAADSIDNLCRMDPAWYPWL